MKSEINSFSQRCLTCWLRNNTLQKSAIFRDFKQHFINIAPRPKTTYLPGYFCTVIESRGFSLSSIPKLQFSEGCCWTENHVSQNDQFLNVNWFLWAGEQTPNLKVQMLKIFVSRTSAYKTPTNLMRYNFLKSIIYWFSIIWSFRKFALKYFKNYFCSIL